jgi:hypothetical protein
MRLLAAALLALAVAACAGIGSERRLSAAELHRLVPGATLEGTIANGGGAFRGTFFPQGTMAIRTASGLSDSGVWTFEGDTVCLSWRNWRDGERYCLYWVRDGDGYAAYFLNGRLSTTFRIVG